METLNIFYSVQGTSKTAECENAGLCKYKNDCYLTFVLFLLDTMPFVGFHPLPTNTESRLRNKGNIENQNIKKDRK